MPACVHGLSVFSKMILVIAKPGLYLLIMYLITFLTYMLLEKITNYENVSDSADEKRID